MYRPKHMSAARFPSRPLVCSLAGGARACTMDIARWCRPILIIYVAKTSQPIVQLKNQIHIR